MSLVRESAAVAPEDETPGSYERGGSSFRGPTAPQAHRPLGHATRRLCGNLPYTAPLNLRSTSTPSMRRLLDGVASSSAVPRRRRRDQRGRVIAIPDTLVDFQHRPEHTASHTTGFTNLVFPIAVSRRKRAQPNEPLFRSWFPSDWRFAGRYEVEPTARDGGRPGGFCDPGPTTARATASATTRSWGFAAAGAAEDGRRRRGLRRADGGRRATSSAAASTSDRRGVLLGAYDLGVAFRGVAGPVSSG